MNQFSNKNKGFTLVEILLTMFIIVFFTGLTLMNYRSGGKHLALQRSANQLAQDIRKAEQKAMSTTKCDECGDTIPEGGYGIYLEKGTLNGKKYILYADRNPANWEYDGSDTQVGADIILEKGVYIHDIEIDGISTNFASINFLAPEPIINISDGVSGDKTIITLALESEPTAVVTVEINTAGLVEIK
jgi:prepilin-type N-terminal cleavage/methylation domain-containing protein